MHGRSLIKKVGKITEYSVTRTRIGPWPIFFLGRLHARVGQTLASSATSFPPTKSFHQLPSVPKERTHHARSLKSCARPERVGKPVACNKTKPLQSPRRFDRVVLSRSAPSFCLSLKLLLDRSLVSKQKGSSESCRLYIDRRGSRRPMQNL